MLSTSTDQQASKDNEDVSDIIQDGPLPSRQSIAISRDILLFLIAFRILNALSIKTFFQPDEYFQSLEPAWQMAFGLNSGPWITWVSQIFPLPCLNQINRGPILTVSGAHAGVEEPSSVLHPSCHFRWRLLGLIFSIQSLKAVPGQSCRASDRSSESDAGLLRGFGGLLYLETWAGGLRTR